MPELESQLRPTPDGRTVFAVWNEHRPTARNSYFAIAVEGEVPIDPDAGPGIDAGATEPDAGPTDAGGAPDAGSPMPDGGGPGLDAGTELMEDGGCGCTSVGATNGSAGAAAWLALGLLGLVISRRRARR